MPSCDDSKILSDELRYKFLSLIEKNPNISQRQLAEEMGVSVGKANYCIKALVEVGHVKLNNFVKSKNKSGYVYVLTKAGIKEKVQVTMRFLAARQVQYDALKWEIARLEDEVRGSCLDRSL